MSFLLIKIIPLIIRGLTCLNLGENSSSKPAEELPQGYFRQQISQAAKAKGYRDIIYYGDRFIAVGTDGKIDYINKYGEITQVVTSCRNDLNCIVRDDQMLVVAGNDGTILVSHDGQVFSRTESGTDININGIAVKNRLFIAGADKGTIFVSKNGKSWSSIHPEVRGNILSLSANDSFYIGITDAGEIIKSGDGFDWEITDYNKKYSGFNKPCIFKKVLAVNNRIAIIGIHEDGSPAVLFSTLGNVWTERTLIYNDDQGFTKSLINKPNDIDYDPARNQFILACDNGEIFSLPSCTKCNTSVKVSADDIYAINCTNNLLISAGEGFSVNILSL